MYVYKVVTERDRSFAGGFDPEDLGVALNHYAREGWRLVEAVHAASIWKTVKAEIVLVLEREVPSTGMN